ncbi:hypothetical protein RHOFW510R12_06915 [Rhodanobacter sp. FW510-R12]|nr:hypothetical protein RHOFW104R8_09760 [Rhodanobacter sp. FW104-R8]KZC33197.1 hypothetical protein RhoFW510R10_09035 [Rhodanobacter sp. FW510-R10]
MSRYYPHVVAESVQQRQIGAGQRVLVPTVKGKIRRILDCPQVRQRIAAVIAGQPVHQWMRGLFAIIGVDCMVQANSMPDVQLGVAHQLLVEVA